MAYGATLLLGISGVRNDSDWIKSSTSRPRSLMDFPSGNHFLYILTTSDTQDGSGCHALIVFERLVLSNTTKSTRQLTPKYFLSFVHHGEPSVTIKDDAGLHCTFRVVVAFVLVSTNEDGWPTST